MTPAFYGVVPATVRYDRNLSPNAILLYIEIGAVMGKDGVARELSAHYMEVFNTSRALILKWLNELKAAGHVYTLDNNGKLALTFTRPEDVKPVEPPKPKLPEPEEDKITVRWVLDEYHRICTGFPKVRVVTDARRKAIKARFAESGKQLKIFTELFTKAQASKFLRGKNPGQKWKADLDFLTSPNGFSRTLEGKYDGSTGTEAPPDSDEL